MCQKWEAWVLTRKGMVLCICIIFPAQASPGANAAALLTVVSTALALQYMYKPYVVIGSEVMKGQLLNTAGADAAQLIRGNGTDLNRIEFGTNLTVFICLLLVISELSRSWAEDPVWSMIKISLIACLILAVSIALICFLVKLMWAKVRHWPRTDNASIVSECSGD